MLAMRFGSPLVAGRLVRRYKRFFADVRLAGGRLVTAHCPNSGSLLGFWPNRLVVEAIEDGTLGELQGYSGIRREVRVSPRSRLDLLLEGGSGRCWVEVKNVTFRVGRLAAFPDAVTERGTRHLRELIRLVRAGHSAALVFVVQRGDCRAFRPADEVDPEYGRWLRRALGAGVEVLPYQARVTPRGISLTRRLELVL
jgi:sugar fermentation stimulation protein A